ncbi:hypothetical protein [Burkholderia aenigmatica]|uniref:hypothetical protein n=1 Tax=Burkholderia aenigmatica TaxID=2015348 RepID=UPI0015840CD4|nr:hypothetical protein [Burkholderia aenigmatica]
MNPPVERIGMFHPRAQQHAVRHDARMQACGRMEDETESRLVSRRVPPEGAARRQRAAVRQEEEEPTDARTPAAASRTAAGILQGRT